MDPKDLEGLSEQERAALEEESEDESTLKAIVDKAGPADDAEDNAGADKGTDEADDAAAKDDDAADPEDKADAKPDAAKPDAKEPEAKQEAEPEVKDDAPSVVFTATAPEDADAQIKTLRAEKAASFKQLMDGEITPEDYSAKEDEILGKIDSLRTEITTANVATKLTLENAQRSYFEKVNNLLDTAKVEGIDYRGNKVLHAALDATVKELAADKANGDKPESWFLQTAHKMVKDSFGLAKPAPVPEKGAKSNAGKPPNMTGLPPTVRNVPAAADSDDGGEFSHLSTLSGMALERELSKMSPEAAQRYLES